MHAASVLLQRGSLSLTHGADYDIAAFVEVLSQHMMRELFYSMSSVVPQNRARGVAWLFLVTLAPSYSAADYK